MQEKCVHKVKRAAQCWSRKSLQSQNRLQKSLLLPPVRGKDWRAGLRAPALRSLPAALGPAVVGLFHHLADTPGRQVRRGPSPPPEVGS